MGSLEALSLEPRKSKKTIVVIEDDPDIGALLLEYLHEEQFYHVFLATDGKKALQLIQGIRPNLFVIDQLLPSMNGLEVYDHLRVMPKFETIPVLIISAGGSEEEVSKRHLPFLRKPFTLEDLDTVVNRLCPHTN